MCEHVLKIILIKKRCIPDRDANLKKNKKNKKREREREGRSNMAAKFCVKSLKFTTDSRLSQLDFDAKKSTSLEAKHQDHTFCYF